jgi:hypothetical protein
MCFVFQLDNQLPGAIFPTVIAPIPPPKSVAAESGKQQMWQPPVEIVLLSLLLCHEIQLKSQNSNCVNCDYFTQNGS